MFLWQIVLESFAYVSWQGGSAVGDFPVGESPAISPPMPVLPVSVRSINLGHFGGFGTLFAPHLCGMDYQTAVHPWTMRACILARIGLYTKVMSMPCPKVRR